MGREFFVPARTLIAVKLLIEKLDKSEKVKKQIWTGPDLDWMGRGAYKNKKSTIRTLERPGKIWSRYYI